MGGHTPVGTWGLFGRPCCFLSEFNVLLASVDQLVQKSEAGEGPEGFWSKGAATEWVGRCPRDFQDRAQSADPAGLEERGQTRPDRQANYRHHVGALENLR